MKRYQIIDPTGQGFPQVIDTSKWFWRWTWRWRWPFLIRLQAGQTYVVASFTRYCPYAQAHAEALADRLNGDGGRICGDSASAVRQQLNDYGVLWNLSPNAHPEGDRLIMDNSSPHAASPISVAVVSGKWCPNPDAETAIILKMLNAPPSLDGRFTAQILEEV